MIALLSTWHGDDAIGWRGLEANPQRTSPTPCAHVRCLRRPRRSPWHPRPEIWLRNRSIASPLAISAERSSNVLFADGGCGLEVLDLALECRVFNFEPTLLILQIVDAGAEPCILGGAQRSSLAAVRATRAATQPPRRRAA